MWKILLPVLLVACASQTEVGGPGARRRCTNLEGKTFASLTQGECGLGPNGPSMCTWHIAFTAVDDFTSHFEWQHSDVQSSGDVACAGTLVYSTQGSDAPSGTYDAATRQLTWEGVVYAP